MNTQRLAFLGSRDTSWLPRIGRSISKRGKAERGVLEREKDGGHRVENH
jgi:hypothetical protein